MKDAAPPLEAGRYRLIETLGEGGMATVYRAWDTRLEVWRAIKVLHPDMAGRASIRTRFENEARTMAKLHHRNMVTVHDVGSEGQRVYMVMEIVEAGSLVDWVEAHGPMPPRLAVRVMTEVLEALQLAHDRGIIHRDIKPHNILIDASGTPKVSDFGIARIATDTDKSLTRTGAVMGTWTYMAPEQRTSARKVDGRADVYAAAATLYALVTGREPFDLYTTELHAEQFEGVPERLADVIKTGTRYKPEDRFTSARVMAEALLAIQRHLPHLPTDHTPLVVPGIALTGASAPPPPLPEEERETGTYYFAASHGYTLHDELDEQAASPSVGAGGSLSAAPVSAAPATVGDFGGTLANEGKPPPLPPELRRGVTLGRTDPSLPPPAEFAPVRRAASLPPAATLDEPPRRRWLPIALVLLALGTAGIAVIGAGGAAAWLAMTGQQPVAEAGDPTVDTPPADPSRARRDTGHATPTPAPTAAPEPEPEAPAPAVAPAPVPRAPTPSPTPTPRVREVLAPAPAPAPAPAAALATVAFSSKPFGAEVWVDGRRLGTTPIRAAEVEAGRRVVRFAGEAGDGTMVFTAAADRRDVLCWDFTTGAECQR